MGTTYADSQSGKEDLISQLEADGVPVLGVITGKGVPRASAVAVEPTGHGTDVATHLQVDDAVAAHRVGLIDRQGRYWWLYDGPIDGSTAVVVVEAESKRNYTDAQKSAVRIVEAALLSAYAIEPIDAPAATEGPLGEDADDSSSDETDPQEEPS